MALKNKDGTEYKLAKPNPIMADQKLWEKEKLIFHNKIGKLIVLPDKTERVVFDSQMIMKTKELLEKTDPVIIKKLEEPEVGSHEDDKIQVWCQPATYKKYKDNLYGEEYQKVNYGSSFLFEAILIDQDDLSFILWTNTKAVTKGSIIFPRTHDKRWWRVQSIREENGGYTIACAISEYQPKFSD